MFQTKVVQKIKTHILGSITFFSENRAVYEMWENTAEEAGRRRQYEACALHAEYQGYKHRHSEYVIRIAFPLQQWLHEFATVLRYTCIACLDAKQERYDDGQSLIATQTLQITYLVSD